MEKIIDQASKIIGDTSEIVLERFKNPYITAFSISWIIFNWKAISFFILSKGNVEYKIKQISIHHSDWLHTFFYPFGVSLIFLFIIPYLNQANEWFLKKSVKNRAEYKKKQFIDKIERDRDIAIAEDEKQTAIKNARESADHNKYIDQLKFTIDETNKLLSEERARNTANNILSQEAQATLTKEISDIQTKYNKQIDLLSRELSEKQRDNNKIIRENQEYISSNQNKDSTINDLTFRVNSFQELLRDYQNVINIQKEFRFNQLSSSNANLLTFEDGTKVLEINTDSPYPKYIDYDNKTTISVKDLDEKMKNHKYSLRQTPLSNSEKTEILNVVYENDVRLNQNKPLI